MTSPKVLPEAMIEELLAAAGKATPGPWSYFYKQKYDEHHVSVPTDGSMRRALFEDGCPTGGADAAFIALANPQTISTLIAEVKAARASRVLQDEGVVAGETTKECKRIIELMDDLRRRAPFGYHEPGSRAPHFRTLILRSADVERLLDALLDAALVAERAERKLAAALAAPPAILPSTIGGSVGVSEEMVDAAVDAWMKSAGGNVSAIMRDALTAALSPAISGEPTGWQPIETAPKDGTEILVYVRTDEGAEMQQVAHWDAHDQTGFPWCVSDGSSYHPDLFTHWQPLPASPSIQAQER